MVVETKWFGQIEVGDEKIITFDKGLMGFENNKKYTIVYNSEKSGDQSIMWLQAVDKKELAIPVMNPEIVMPDYDPIVEDELLSAIGDIKDADLVILVTLTVPSDITKITSNMRAPIIINSDNLKGCQLIADNDEYKIKYPIYEILKNDSEKGGE